jgi:hypothetical protein
MSGLGAVARRGLKFPRRARPNRASYFLALLGAFCDLEPASFCGGSAIHLIDHPLHCVEWTAAPIPWPRQSQPMLATSGRYLECFKPLETHVRFRKHPRPRQ